MIPKWVSRFEVKPNRWVYHPTNDTLKIGKKIKADVAKVWTAPSYYYHLRSGGHLEALRQHLASTTFLHLDITDFFGCVNRTRVTRCLKSRLGYEEARWIAKESTVSHPGEQAAKVLPYGFPQSPILASLALSESRLGKALDRIAKTKEVRISVYVDDIILSVDRDGLLQGYLEELRDCATASRFQLNEAKQEGPGPTIRAFNVNLAQANLEVAPDRVKQFEHAVTESTNQFSIDAMVTYVKCVNQEQGDALAVVAQTKATPQTP